MREDVILEKAIMSYNNHSLLLTVGIVTFLILSSVQVSAHSPSSMTVLYDADNSELAVQVEHAVTSPSTHYIEQIVILKNTVEVASREYTSQNSTAGMSDVFAIEAAVGDVISVTASCSVSGSITRQITVAASTTTSSQTTTTTGQGGDQPVLLILIGGIAVVIVVLAVIAVLRRM